MWTRLTSWWFTTFMAPAIKQKLHNVYEAGFFYFSRCSQNLLNLNDQKYSVHLFACKGLHREELNLKNIIQSINSPQSSLQPSNRVISFIQSSVEVVNFIAVTRKSKQNEIF